MERKAEVLRECYIIIKISGKITFTTAPASGFPDGKTIEIDMGDEYHTMYFKKDSETSGGGFTSKKLAEKYPDSQMDGAWFTWCPTVEVQDRIDTLSPTSQARPVTNFTFTPMPYVEPEKGPPPRP